MIAWTYFLIPIYIAISKSKMPFANNTKELLQSYQVVMSQVFGEAGVFGNLSGNIYNIGNI